MRALPFLLILMPLCFGQPPQPSFRADVRLINISFSARDARGMLVADLTKDDIEVLDDGVPQTIAFFARSEELPLSLGLLADVSGSQEPFVKRHKSDLKEFLKSTLQPRDRAFLVCFGNRLRLAADFSSSAHAIVQGFERFDRGKSAMPELGPPEVRVLGTGFYDALYYAATEKLAPAEHVRKALIMFSDGEDNSSAHHMMDAIEAAQTENIPVYGIRYTERKDNRLNARNKYGIRVMERISSETGGMDFDAAQTDLKKAFRAIGEELRSAYELAYHATNKINDGRFRKLTIQCKRPGVVLRTKTGYYARD